MHYKYRGDVGYIDLAVTLIMSLVIGTTLMLGIKGIMTGPEGTNLSRQLYNELTTQVVNAPFQHGYDSDSLVKIYLDQDSITLLPKQQKQITYQLYPANAADKTVLWSIGNSNVATVSNAGLVTGVAEGDTVVYATTKTGVRASCKVHVDPLVYINFSTSWMQLRIGAVTDTGKINYTLNPANAKNKLVTWVSSDSNVASVDVNGNVTPHNPGDTVITGTTYTGNYAQCTVHVIRVWYLTLSAGTGGYVTPAGSNLYQEGTWITIAANPYDKYKFTQWSDGNGNASRSFAIYGNISLTAYFKQSGYTWVYSTSFVSSSSSSANIWNSATLSNSESPSGRYSSGIAHGLYSFNTPMVLKAGSTISLVAWGWNFQNASLYVNGALCKQTSNADGFFSVTYDSIMYKTSQDISVNTIEVQRKCSQSSDSHSEGCECIYVTPAGEDTFLLNNSNTSEGQNCSNVVYAFAPSSSNDKHTFVSIENNYIYYREGTSRSCYIHFVNIKPISRIEVGPFSDKHTTDIQMYLQDANMGYSVGAKKSLSNLNMTMAVFTSADIAVDFNNIMEIHLNCDNGGVNVSIPMIVYFTDGTSLIVGTNSCKTGLG